jgi:hypothetical protein
MMGKLMRDHDELADTYIGAVVKLQREAPPQSGA